jgi:hypothetical protein
MNMHEAETIGIEEPEAMSRRGLLIQGASLAAGLYIARNTLLLPGSAQAQSTGEVCTTEPDGSQVCVEEESSTIDETTTEDFTHQFIPEDERDHGDRSGARGRRRPRGDRYVHFNQGDWGARIASSGCGPTSAAEVITNVSGHYATPRKMADILSPKYYIPGSGTRPEAFKYLGRRFNLEVHKTDLDDARDVIKYGGGLAIVHASPGYFTGLGHYMVLKDVKSGKFRISDPNGRGKHGDSESRLWSAAALRSNGVDAVWTFQAR